MPRKKVTRREAMKATAVGMGALATTSIVGGSTDARARSRPIEVTITLDSGSFLTNIHREDVVACEIGYFESDPAMTDLRVYADGEEVNPSRVLKLGKGNRRIDVIHTRLDGSVNEELVLTKALRKHLLRRGDLYEDVPEWNRSAFDCIFNFTSGRLTASGVKPAMFKQRLADGGEPTGQALSVRPIARDVVVSFELERGEALRFTRDDGTDLWSTAEIEPGAKRIEIQITADETTAEKFFGFGLKHTTERFWLLSDPPPMNGNNGGG